MFQPKLCFLLFLDQIGVSSSTSSTLSYFSMVKVLSMKEQKPNKAISLGLNKNIAKLGHFKVSV